MMDDRIKFDALFRAYYKRMFFFARQMVDNEEECHDIAMAVFESAWNHRDELEASTVGTWLYVATRNLCINHLRREDRRMAYADFCRKTSEVYTDADLTAEEDERRAVVRFVLDGMKSPTREILEACYVEGKKYREVAEEMGVSLSTVKKHMVKALKIIDEMAKNCKIRNIEAS